MNTVQPGQGGGWMAIPPGVTHTPPGLEYLTMVDQLLVHQQIEMIEAFTSFETNNRYEVKNAFGQRVYMAAEETNCCTRNCCGPGRAFEMKILDNTAREVLRFHRFWRCDSCWFPCCLQKMEVFSSNGNIIGYVEQSWSVVKPSFKILNAEREVVLRIQGPLFTCSVCGDVEFQVLTSDGEQRVGEIRKQWTGILKETFTDADNFGVTFPLDLDVNVKATLLGAVFLIDFMFFEKRGQKPNDVSPGMW